MPDPERAAQRLFYDRMWRQRSASRNLDELCRVRAIHAFCRSLRLRDANILELGCGTGWLAHELSRYGRVTAIDFSEAAIARAASDYPHIAFHAGDLFEAERLGSRFDLIVSSEVIEHVSRDDQRRFMELVDRILAPDGRLILTTPNKPVASRMPVRPEQLQPIENWLSASELAALLAPRFRALSLRTAFFGAVWLRRHPRLSWLRYVLYCRLNGLAPIESLLSRSGGGLYLCCLAARAAA